MRHQYSRCYWQCHLNNLPVGYLYLQAAGYWCVCHNRAKISGIVAVLLILQALLTIMIQRTIDIRTTPLAAFERESKRLMMCLEEDNLLLVLADKQNGSWNALENYALTKEGWQHLPASLQQVKQQSSLANLKVPDTQLYFRTNAAMPIPAGLQGGAALFIQAQFGWQAPDEIHTEEVTNSVNVSMIIPAPQITAFRHLYPQATWHSTLALLIKQAQQLQGKTMLPQLFITLSSSLAEMVLMKSDQLLIARCFPFYTAENLLYHVLNTCRQLGISPAEVFIKAQGLIDEQHEIYVLLHQYFTHVALITAGTQLRDAAFDSLPVHHYTHLAGN